MAFLTIAALLFGLLLIFSSLNNQTISDYARQVLHRSGVQKGGS